MRGVHSEEQGVSRASALHAGSPRLGWACIFVPGLRGRLAGRNRLLDNRGMIPARLTPLVLAAALSPLAGAAARTELPKVLLIGDSISIGYTPHVVERLSGMADVQHHPGNAGHTGNGLARLEQWLGDEPWDVIHFNFGLHDLCWRTPGKRDRNKATGVLTNSPERYRENLRAITARLQQTGAQLVFATTTPVPEGEIGRYAGDARRYNDVARQVMAEAGVPINDLFAIMDGRMEQYARAPGDVHFTQEGRALLGESVVLHAHYALARGQQGRRLPNVVLVVVDDLGWSDLGCMGSRFYETPFCDKLASEGVRLTQAYAASAVCSPSRAALMTGRHPARVGITDWIHHAGPEARRELEAGKHSVGYDEPRGRRLLTPINRAWLPAEELTLAEMFKANGYATCHVGKWHLGPEGHLPTDQGFDHNKGGFEVGQPPSYFDPYSNARFDGIVGLPSRFESEYLTGREVDEALHFLHQNRETPFFLHLSHYAVHSPLQAPEKLVGKYSKKELENPAPPQVGSGHENPTYAAMIEMVDRSLGKILAHLDDYGHLYDTIVVFTSDNGGASHFDATDNAPLRAGKGFPYEAGHRVPMLVRWPRAIPPGVVSAQPVIGTDLFPTLLAACGLQLPAVPLDGVDLLPHLTTGEPLERQELVWHFPHYWWGTRVQPYSVLRQGDRKLVRHWEDGRLELFDLAQDPGEALDLASAHPIEAQHMSARLDELLAGLNARLPIPNPALAEDR